MQTRRRLVRRKEQRDRLFGQCGVVALATALLSGSAGAHDITDWLSVGGVAAAVGQCQLLTDDAGASDDCRGALPIQPELSIRPTDQDELFVKLGFAVGNGLNKISPFALAPFGADLEDDQRNINGRYDYVLNAWYKHEFRFTGDTTLPDDATLGISVGIIDATDYLDDNAFANDEFTQFLNEALVNAPSAFLPSYDVGGAIEFGVGNWSLRAVVMNVGENDDGNSYAFYGAQVGYRAETAWGEGNYRLFAVATSDDFSDPEGTGAERLLGLGLSFDQELADDVGAWLRFAWQDQSAAVDYKAIYSGGLNIGGGLWGRPDDNIGLGYAFLDGGNLDLRSTHVAEIYYRLAFLEHFAITADAQYMRDNLKDDDGPAGFILGLRATAEF